jgi:hypothetical protein
MADRSGGAQPRFVRPVTPAELLVAIKALIERIAPGQVPVYVDVVPLPGEAANECFGLVDQCVEERGGEAVIGWSLWEFPTLFVEAEFHAVWQKPDGALVDVAPKPSATARVLFLPDPKRRYEGRGVDNVRWPLRQDPVVIAYLTTFESMFELMNRGNRAGQHGEIRLHGKEATEWRSLAAEQAALDLKVKALAPAAGPYHPCLCGSGKKVKWRCGALA